eukprot:CAMPEP_0183560634 /NCGR_PEP_ID=MMETSP0371-20130417/95339_1 /TAXON_ID=268820 /ORGANISM="Peridinium aciculiferum, Strain PAER-2" /LENGTH=57 /DNA_ID=CAMNT_0025768897 /DNA_START=40 /DNA_END=209 /DNA_ORIENTATION=+
MDRPLSYFGALPQPALRDHGHNHNSIQGGEVAQRNAKTHVLMRLPHDNENLGRLKET